MKSKQKKKYLVEEISNKFLEVFSQLRYQEIK